MRENNRKTSEQVGKLIDAANIQACAAQKIADASGRNAAAAESFSKSAGAINTQTTKAVGEFTRLADATQRAAKIAQDTLHISERAYIATGSPQIDYAKNLITVPLVNSGHIPSGKVELVSYEATLNPDKMTEGFTSFEYIVERHKGITHLTSIPPGLPPVVSIAFPIPKMSKDRLNNGTQLIMIVGTISYSDGFPNSPIQRSPVCTSTVYQTVAKDVYLAPCNAAEQLPKFEAMDWSGLTQEY